MVPSRVSGGKLLTGIHVDSHKFQGVSTLNELEDYGLVRPTAMQTKKSVASLELGQRGERLAKLRADIQRTWDKSRTIRAEVFSKYIEAVECDGEKGGTAAITIFAPEIKSVEEHGLVIPYSGQLIAIDGETQLESRYMLRDRKPVTGDNSVAITAYHGVTEEAARQILHDYNRYAKPISEGKLGSFSSTGALSKAVADGLAAAGLHLETDINRVGKLPGKKYVASYTQLMHFLTGFTMGEEALSTDNLSRYFDALNQATASEALNHGAAVALGDVLVLARNTDAVRQAPTQVWACAGARSKSGKKHIDWQGGITAYNQTRVRGRGGERVKVKDRMAAIYQAV